MEICVDSLESAISAERGGAARLELCSCLDVGGVTPSLGLLQRVKEVVRIPTFVLIRPRPSDFLNTDEELGVMLKDMKVAKDAGADGFVFGILTKDGYVDEVKTSSLIRAARPLPVTFHRAIDMCSSPLDAIETLVKLGCQRVLTSGQKSTAYEGRVMIQKMHQRANGRISIMPGGGITEANLQDLIETTNCSEFHGSARIPVDSQMIYRNSDVAMGRINQEYQHFICSVDKVKNMVNIIHQRFV